MHASNEFPLAHPVNLDGVRCSHWSADKFVSVKAFGQQGQIGLITPARGVGLVQYCGRGVAASCASNHFITCLSLHFLLVRNHLLPELCADRTATIFRSPAWRTATQFARGLSLPCSPSSRRRPMPGTSRSGRRPRPTRGGRSQDTSYSRVCYASAPNYDIAASRFTLAESTGGQGFIHKAKLNNNGSFSVGKTWKLSELRGLEVLNVSA